MGAIIIRVSNASRRPLDDRIDIEVTSTQSDATIARVNDVAGNAPIRITGLDERLTYRVSVLPRRHRPVARMAFAGPDDRPTTLEFHAPLHPERVRAVTFPLYPDLPRELRDVLEASTIDGLSAEALYTALTEVQRAGLLNVFSKMARLTIDGRSAWSFVERVYGVRPDRIYIDVSTSFRDLVGAAATAGLLMDTPWGRTLASPLAAEPQSRHQEDA